MFKVLASGSRKRSVWSANTVATSIIVHALVLGFAAYASLHASPPRAMVDGYTDIGEPPPPPPVEPEQKQETPPPVDAPPPRPGQTVELPAPDVVPTVIPKVDPTEQPLHAYQTTGIGTTGSTYDPNATAQAPAAPGAGQGDGPEVIAAEELGALPELANRTEVQRVLQRNYPPTLRDAGIAGEAQIQLIINTDGSVDASSVKVVSSSQEAFGEAARRVVERFRFRPASMMGEPVRVLITMPIRFTVAPTA
ncbi:MAG TPA: TonB family protein [Longimicrobiaceae bacterium]|nr:TonB family protein [Longimicrobiaceae bacterium]